jgi:excinuclease ABC subunit C
MTDGEKKRTSNSLYGPYPGLNRKAAFKLLRKIFRFSTCRPDAKRPCLYRQMGQCQGVCTGEISSRDYRRISITPLATFLRGGKKVLVKKWETDMKRSAKAEDFERAAQLRDQLSALYRIHDIALLNESFVRDVYSETDDSNILRIEGYDISNLGNSGIVGSMVVFMHGEPDKSQYRKFEIKTVKVQSDVDSLREMLTRRFKRLASRDTRFAAMNPDLLLIDGGKPQLNTAVDVAKELGITIPIISIAKGTERKRNDFFFAPKTDRDVINWVDRHKDVLIRVRDEAHRFAITYQRKKRKIQRK